MSVSHSQIIKREGITKHLYIILNYTPQSQTDLFFSDLTPPIYHLHMLYTYNPIQPDLSYTFLANQGISQPSHT